MGPVISRQPHSGGKVPNPTGFVSHLSADEEYEISLLFGQRGFFLWLKVGFARIKGRYL